MCDAINILSFSLKDHYNSKAKGRKMGPKTTLTIVEKLKLVKYMLNMQNLAHLLNVDDLKLKLYETYQGSLIPFKDGILEKSWLKWFKRRHLQLVLRIPHCLDLNRAKSLCPFMIAKFYKNLQNIYIQQEFQPTYMWNMDESGVMPIGMG